MSRSPSKKPTRAITDAFIVDLTEGSYEPTIELSDLKDFIWPDEEMDEVDPNQLVDFPWPEEEEEEEEKEEKEEAAKEKDAKNTLEPSKPKPKPAPDANLPDGSDFVVGNHYRYRLVEGDPCSIYYAKVGLYRLTKKPRPPRTDECYVFCPVEPPYNLVYSNDAHHWASADE